jgi:hypothetical protein
MEIEEIETTPAVAAEFNTTQIIMDAALRGVVYAIALTATAFAVEYGLTRMLLRGEAKRAKKMNETETPLTVVQ